MDMTVFPWEDCILASSLLGGATQEGYFHLHRIACVAFLSYHHSTAAFLAHVCHRHALILGV